MMDIKKLVSDLLGSADKSVNNYERALEAKQESIIVLQQSIQDEQIKLKEFHKMSILSEITEETYMEQKNVVAALQEKLSATHTEIDLIATYKSEDIDAILANIAEVKPEYNKKQQADIATIQQGIAEARQAYVDKLSELGNRYDKSLSTESRLQNFLIDMGRQPNLYLPNKMEILGSGASVSPDDVNRAL